MKQEHEIHTRERGTRNPSVPANAAAGSPGHNGINPRDAINTDTANVAVVRHVAAAPYLRLREMR